MKLYTKKNNFAKLSLFYSPAIIVNSISLTKKQCVLQILRFFSLLNYFLQETENDENTVKFMFIQR